MAKATKTTAATVHHPLPHKFIAINYRLKWHRPKWYHWPMGAYKTCRTREEAEIWLNYRTRGESSPKGRVILTSYQELADALNSPNYGLKTAIINYCRLYQIKLPGTEPPKPSNYKRLGGSV